MTKKIPVTIPYFTDEESEAVREALSSGWVAQGPRVTRFEELIAAHEGAGYGVATTSCTTALHLAMAAGGLKAGMDAIVPAFTFVATANAVLMTGAEPVFCDICQETFNISIDSLKQVIRDLYEERDGVPVVYSLGNCVFGGNTNPKDHDALAVQAELSFNEGELEMITLHFYPVSVSGEAGRNDYSPVLLEGADAERVLKKMEDSTGVSPGAFDPVSGAVVSVSVKQ